MCRMVNEEQLLEPLSKLFARKITKFPGMMPTSVDRSNVALLHRGYVASPKADGDAVLGFISQNKLVLWRRNMQAQTFILSHIFDRDFIFDGEYFAHRNHFLIFDTLVFQDEPVFRVSYDKRLELANHFINVMCPSKELFAFANTFIKTPDIQPLPSNYPHGITWQSPNISMQVKPAYDSRLSALLWNARRSLPYNCDGIIFTRLWCRYYPFSENVEAVLKWKLHVTTDFLVKPIIVAHNNKNSKNNSNNNGVNTDTILCNKEGNAVHLPQSYAFPANGSQHNALLYALHNADCIPVSSCVLETDEIVMSAAACVCEFSWNQELCIWELQRLRPDKVVPNTLHTVIACIASIRDAITIDEIADAVI